MSASLQRKKVIACASIVVSLSVIAALLLYSPFRRYQELESATWDTRLGFAADPSLPDPKIRIIDIDQSSLTALDEDKIRWQWPREVYVPILEYLKIGGARGLAIDMFYTEQSSSGVSDDEAFADAVRNTIPVIFAVQARGGSKQLTSYPQFREKLGRQSNRSSFAERYLMDPHIGRFSSALIPIPQLTEAAAGFGMVNPMPDSDGKYRHYIPGVFIEDIAIPSLPFALYSLAYPDAPKDISRFMDSEGRLPLRFYGPQKTFRTYSFASIYYSFLNIAEGRRPVVPPEDFKDALVFLGTSAPGLMDLRVSPLDPQFPGVEVNATVLDNLLHERFFRKTAYWFNVLVSILAIAATTISVFFLFRGRSLDAVLALIIVSIIAGSFGMALLGWWMPLVTPLLCTVVASIASLAFQYQLEGRQHKFIKDAFKYYVSPTVIDKIVDDPTKLTLGGERRELTIYFSDIAGFTTLSESMDPTKLVVLLNIYLSAMTDIIMESGGTVDKYEGDAIIAFWNAPLPVPDHAFIGVRGALQCQQKLREMQQMFKNDFGVELKTRIGLNSGTVSVGNFGSSERFNYTMIGDAANLASRLEGVNKVFGTLIIISDSTRSQIGDRLLCREIGGIRVVGKSTVVRIYEPISENPTAEMVAFVREFDEARSAFEAGELARAKSLFEAMPHDPVAKVYLQRLEKDGLDRDAEWSPVWNLTEK